MLNPGCHLVHDAIQVIDLPLQVRVVRRIGFALGLAGYRVHASSLVSSIGHHLTHARAGLELGKAKHLRVAGWDQTTQHNRQEGQTTWLPGLETLELNVA